MNGDLHSSIFDAKAGISLNNNFVKLVSCKSNPSPSCRINTNSNPLGYDNEMSAIAHIPQLCDSADNFTGVTQDVFLIFWPTSPRSTETHKWWNKSVTGVGFAARSLPQLVPLPQKLYIQRIHDFQCASRSSRDDYMYLLYGIHAILYRVSLLRVGVAMLTLLATMYLGLMSTFCSATLISHVVDRRRGPSQALYLP